jgi:hypothetical protein
LIPSYVFGLFLKSEQENTFENFEDPKMREQLQEKDKIIFQLNSGMNELQISSHLKLQDYNKVTK